MNPPPDTSSKTKAEHAGLCVSIVILTLNEEINIEPCLASCQWCDDVHILDSGSQDQTQTIAQELGATVHTHPFESFGKQRSWAIDNIDLKHNWVFHLDADERFTPELVNAIDTLLKSNPEQAGFHVPSKLMFMGKWLKRAGGYPTYQVRLFHKKRMRFTDYGHGQREQTTGTIGVLDEPYLHHSFAKGLYDWFDKHNRYSSLEAFELVSRRDKKRPLSSLFITDPIARRRAWKETAYRVPLWPWIRWCYTMFIVGAVLEGRPGWTYARLMAIYEQMTQLKVRVLTRGESFETDQLPQNKTEIFDAQDRLASPAASSTSTPAQSNSPPDRTDELGQLLPESSPWTFKEKVGRAIWMLVGRPIFRLSFHNWYGFRRQLLRFFGAKVARGVRLRPSVNIEVPWNIILEEDVTVGDQAILYSLGTIHIGARTIVSQYAHLCAGTHDHTDRRFPLIRDPIHIESDAWIGADAYVGPNVTVGRLSVLGARSSAYKDLEPQMVYVGNPAKPIKSRELHEAHS